jgi:uncharacterized cupredoxin-like copper-binding protein
MNLNRWITLAGGATAIFGMVALSGPAAWAQDATPEAEVALSPRPAHIHSGNCAELGDVVVPLTDLTAPQGDRVGQGRRASVAETSYTSVPMTLDAILAEDHAINVHLSAEEIGTYIACGELGGILTPDGALVVGLGELNDSGYTGIAFLAPGADGASTDVSAFIAPTNGGGGRNRDQATDDAAVGGEDAAAADDATEAVQEADTDDAEGTPMAMAEGAEMTAGQQVPVSLMEFAIDMPQSLPAGPVTFAVTNDGTITHSFEIESADMEEELAAELEPGESGMLTVDLAPGTYEVYCPIGNHADQGMMVEVTVN